MREPTDYEMNCLVPWKRNGDWERGGLIFEYLAGFGL